MARSRLKTLICALLFATQTFAYTELTDETLQALSYPGEDFDIKTGSILSPILVPRVSGTEASSRVLQHFVDFWRDQLPEWNISFQNSTSKTPATGDRDIPFINFIATRDPPWAGTGEVSYLTLTAHYDSKYTPEGFVGATDSAAPCAMIMHAAREIDQALTAKWTRMQEEGVGEGGFADTEDNRGVQVVLFDGEEAFLSWNDNDSIYGARSLAAEWEGSVYPALSTYKNPLDAIDLFVLLDLLGAESPKVPSYYPTTHWAYKRMSTLEGRLRGLGKFKSDPKAAKREASKRQEAQWLFDHDKDDSPRWAGGAIGDDHVPFLKRGVEVLHLITSPFPSVWHTMQDDAEHLHMETVEDWAILTTAFVGEWMDLEGFLPSGSGGVEGSAHKMAPRDEL